MRQKHLTYLVAIPLSLATSWADGKPRTSQLSELVPLGALSCDARRAGPDTQITRLNCGLRFGSGTDATFVGEMDGKGLYLVYPGAVRVIWRVLSRNAKIEPAALAGTYSSSSDQQLARKLGNSNVFVGGQEGAVVLELLAPQIDAIGPQTHLSLRQTG